MAVIAWISIGVAIACAVCIAADEVRHPQKMAVMNIVWPVTALYFSVFALWAYFRIGRSKASTGNEAPDSTKPRHRDSEEQSTTPTLQQVALSASHCGAGCMLADVVSEFGIAFLGITLLGSVLWAEYAIDLAAAWALGIAFQYFAIKPMKKLTPMQALASAIKADTLSILAFQVGMYGFMAIVFFKLFPHPHLTPFQPTYWLLMQIAMVCGYATALPMNWWLIKIGIKEAM